LSEAALLERPYVYLQRSVRRGREPKKLNKKKNKMSHKRCISRLSGGVTTEPIYIVFSIFQDLVDEISCTNFCVDWLRSFRVTGVFP
jgi:hypothetical protein